MESMLADIASLFGAQDRRLHIRQKASRRVLRPIDPSDVGRDENGRGHWMAGGAAALDARPHGTDEDKPYFAHPLFWAPFAIVGESGLPRPPFV